MTVRASSRSVYAEGACCVCGMPHVDDTRPRRCWSEDRERMRIVDPSTIHAIVVQVKMKAMAIRRFVIGSGLKRSNVEYFV